jgi:hypothetical protein
MKKLSLAVTVLALAAVGCDDDSSTTKADAGMDSGQNTIPDANGGEPDPYPNCDRDGVESYPDYEGGPVWTSAQQMACGTACGMVPEAESEKCIMDNCPDYDKFNECANGVLLSCLTGSDGDCRRIWENYICCADEAKCEESTTQEAFDMCIDSNCQDRIGAVTTCIDEEADPNSQIPDPCIVQVFNRCIKPMTNLDAGMDDDAGADGGVSTKSLGLVHPLLLKQVKLRAAELRKIAR